MKLISYVELNNKVFHLFLLVSMFWKEVFLTHLSNFWVFFSNKILINTNNLFYFMLVCLLFLKKSYKLASIKREVHM